MLKYPHHPSHAVVITHVSDPKRRTAWTTTLKNSPNTQPFAPSLPRTRDSCAYFFRYFRSFLTTAGQSSSEAVRKRPIYLNNDTKVSGYPYAWKARYILAWASSAAKICRFCSTPFSHWAVLRLRPLCATHGTSMSHRGHHWWGRFLSSKTTTVSWTWQCMKCMCIPVRVVYCPSTGKYRGPIVIGKEIW